MKRVVLVGGGSPLAVRIAERMEQLPGVERVDRELDAIPLAPDPRPFGEYLVKERIDTVVQCGLVPDRSGIGSHARDADVIGTMCLGAAIGQSGSLVRSWVLASSSAVYPIGSHAPLLHDERQPTAHDEDALAASIVEAEDYARESAYRLPHVNVAILRLQQLVAPGVRGPLAAVLARDPVPSPLGFDPGIQLLHLEDASDAMVHAARSALAGLYNVASSGLIHWSDALRATGRRSLPLLPLSAGPFEALLERLGLPCLPGELVALLRYGHAIDTRKLERTGWRARHDQLACLEALAES